MQMIDVLKRLAELDADNPRVESKMIQDQTLLTQTNAQTQVNESVNECGPMGMMGGMDRPSTPASISINASAATGEEVAGMLSQIMTLAGVKPVSQEPAFAAHKQIELEPAHPLEPADDMANTLAMIDKMNTPDDMDQDGSDNLPADHDKDHDMIKSMDVDGDGDHDMDDHEKEKKPEEGNAYGQAVQNTPPGEEIKIDGKGTGDIKKSETYSNTPEPEVEPHKYGDDQVTPKPQGLKQRLGDNPYEPVKESEEIQSISLQLLKAYQEFKNQQ